MKYIDQISVGNYIVLESGTIVSHQNEDITFEVKTLNFVFKFVTDEKTEEAKVESKVEDMVFTEKALWVFASKVFILISMIQLF